jgi:fumarylacetoacetate (FAA) hydrolase family protein
MNREESAMDVKRLAACLPEDGLKGALAGRLWRADHGGPAVVALRAEHGAATLFDITRDFPTLRDLCETPDPASALKAATGERIGTLEEVLAGGQHRLLAPLDLQAVKAAGVTFAASMLERVIEERARGDASAAEAIRAEVLRLVGDDLARLKPGSEAAMALKSVLIAQGVWSQYLEVGIGPDAEIFTKAQPMSSVGHGAQAGLHPMSTWNNPEPEVVLIVASDGRIVGASLGNDVNLRDVEGRSALLLGKAKDNNAACAVGPFVRFFDASFALDDVRNAEISLTVEGEDGFVMEGRSNMAKISRDPVDLTGQMLGRHHQYPDGAALFCGTMFAPVQDRDTKGGGFTHKMGDIVTIASPKLGKLVNVMRTSTQCAPWTYGVSHLMRYLAGRGYL